MGLAYCSNTRSASSSSSRKGTPRILIFDRSSSRSRFDLDLNAFNCFSVITSAGGGRGAVWARLCPCGNHEGERRGPKTIGAVLTLVGFVEDPGSIHDLEDCDPGDDLSDLRSPGGQSPAGYGSISLAPSVAGAYKTPLSSCVSNGATSRA